MTEETTDTTASRARPDGDGIRHMGTRVGQVMSAALTDTAFAAVGLSAYAVDLVKSLRVTPEAARTAGDWTVRGATMAGEQIARGFRTLSLRGHRVLGVAPGLRRPQQEAAADHVEPDPYTDATITELRERARKADIAGRSTMTRRELIDALHSQESEG